MKRITSSIIILLMFVVISCGEPEVQRKDLNTENARISYGLGLDFGTNLKKQNVSIDMNALKKGFEDGYRSGEKLLSPDELKQAQETFQQRYQVMSDEAKANGAVGREFLIRNQHAEGVVVLPDGLQYKVIREGSGPIPKPDDVVVCNYIGWHVDGTEIENTYKLKSPHTFPIDQVLKGWSEALTKMKVGSKWKLFIPPSLGFGLEGNGMAIKQNETLIYEIELMEIAKF